MTLDLSTKPTIQGARFWSDKINQLYHPTGEISQDSQEIVYSRGNLNTNKFSQILLKEWFYLVKKDGFLVVDYEPNSFVDWQKLEEYMWWLWKGKYEIIYHGPIKSQDLKKQTPKTLSNYIKGKQQASLPYSATETEGKTLRFVCRKISSTLLGEDSIDKWTFGIVTNGKRLDWLGGILTSIRKQKIPHYEIVICGYIPSKPEKDIRFIPFSERDDKGWISRKKNIIVKNAKFENICVIHDRLEFDADWYKGMKKWGNCFDHLGCVQKYKGNRINDWEFHEDIPNLEFSFVSLLDYRDWDIQVCEGGQLHIVKKSFAVNVLWNETYYWGRPEDLRISNDLRDQGHILRFNPYSTFKVLAYKFGNIPSIPYDTMKLSAIRTGNWKRVLSRKIYKSFSNLSLTRKLMLWLFKKITK